MECLHPYTNDQFNDLATSKATRVIRTYADLINYLLLLIYKFLCKMVNFINLRIFYLNLFLNINLNKNLKKSNIHIQFLENQRFSKLLNQNTIFFNIRIKWKMYILFIMFYSSHFNRKILTSFKKCVKCFSMDIVLNSKIIINILSDN